MNFNLPTLGLVVIGLIVFYFVVRGNKKDLITWIVTIVGIALILLVVFEWGSISRFIPGSAATAAPPSATHQVVHVVHSTPTALPTAPPAATPKATVQHQGIVAAKPASPAPSPDPFTRFITVLGNFCALVFSGVLALCIVALLLIRKRKPYTTVFFDEKEIK